jgi:hypothetical protein
MKTETENLAEQLDRLAAIKSGDGSVQSMLKESAEQLRRLYKTLDGLHIVCETSPPEIFSWYINDQFATEARDNALAILTERAATTPNVES